MYQSMGFKFQRKYIDVYIVSAINKQFCDPIVIRSGMSEKLFIISLAHELTHLLFIQNHELFSHKKLRLKYPNESLTTQNHIYTYAFLKYYFIDVLDDHELFDENIRLSENAKNAHYRRAWEIVEKIGYKKLLNEQKNRSLSP